MLIFFTVIGALIMFGLIFVAHPHPVPFPQGRGNLLGKERDDSSGLFLVSINITVLFPVQKHIHDSKSLFTKNPLTQPI